MIPTNEGLLNLNNNPIETLSIKKKKHNGRVENSIENLLPKQASNLDSILTDAAIAYYLGGRWEYVIRKAISKFSVGTNSRKTIANVLNELLKDGSKLEGVANNLIRSYGLY